MFCTKCGSETKAGARFCGKCGAQIGGVTPPYQQPGQVGMNVNTSGYTYQNMGIPPIQLDLKKIIYLALVVLAVILSFSKVISVEDMWGWDEELISLTYSELVEYLKELSSLASMFGEETTGTGLFSLGLFCLRLGTIAIVAGAVILFIRPKYSFGFNVSGAILNIVSMAIIVLAGMSLASELGGSDAEGLTLIAGTVWIFIIVNIVIIILSSPGQIYESDFEEAYAGKRYDHLEGAYRDKSGTWICADCGKQNNASMSHCTCGRARMNYTRRY